MKTLILAGLLGLTLVGCGKKEEVVVVSPETANYLFLKYVKDLASLDKFDYINQYQDEQLLQMGDVICKSMERVDPKDLITEILLKQPDPDKKKAQLMVAVSAVSKLCPERKNIFMTTLKEVNALN